MPRYHSPGFEPIELVVFAATSVYTMALTDQIVEFNLTTPAAISVTGPSRVMTVGKIYTIKDGAGNAATNNITFTPNSGTGTIDGATSYVINTNNGSLSFYFDGVNLKIVNASRGGGGITSTPQALTFGSTVAWGISSGTNATITATSNIPFTLSNPTNLSAGQGGMLTFTQFSTGGQIITWDSNYRGPGGVKPTLSTGNGAIDEIAWYSPDGTHVDLVGQLAFS